MQDNIDILYKEVYSEVYRVYEVFQNFFGEEYVDLQGILEKKSIKAKYKFYYTGNENTSIEGFREVLPNCHIIVWWPEVTVTNEVGKSIVIKDLFAKIFVSPTGKIPLEVSSFRLIRTSYTYNQYASGYMHSHLPRFYNDEIDWESPCLGTGPLVNTLTELKLNGDDYEWMLFCQELASYVTVESLEGVPYIRLESVGKDSRHSVEKWSYVFNSLLRLKEYLGDKAGSFLRYYFEHCNIQFNFIQDHFTVGLTDYYFIINMSNVFIDWLNIFGTKELISSLKKGKILLSVFCDNNNFYLCHEPSSSNNNKRLIKFKDKYVSLKLMKSDSDPTSSIIISPDIAISFKEYIENKLNYYYYERNGKCKKVPSDSERTVHFL